MEDLLEGRPDVKNVNMAMQCTEQLFINIVLNKTDLERFNSYTGWAIFSDVGRDYFAWKTGNPSSIWVKLIPIPSMLGIPAFIGGYFTVDMTIGAIILGIWQYFAPADALTSAPIVASALIAGDGECLDFLAQLSVFHSLTSLHLQYCTAALTLCRTWAQKAVVSSMLAGVCC